jgi:nucleoporin NUP82
MADPDQDWPALLATHPIFTPPPRNIPDELGEASKDVRGRRQVMLLKDADLILAAGTQIRIASLGVAKPKGYKVFLFFIRVIYPN